MWMTAFGLAALVLAAVTALVVGMLICTSYDLI
jgi:hypothetical protein